MKIIKKICDRCGKEIPEVLPMMQSILPVYNIKRYSADVDLCNDCLKEFDDFMEGKTINKSSNCEHEQEIRGCSNCLHELKPMAKLPCRLCNNQNYWEPKK